MSDKNSSQKNWTSWHHLLHKEILGNKTLIPNGANLLIAVSGGQDSMALLGLINDMKTQHNWFVNVWHGDHQWHEKSETYALDLQSYCNKKNISFFFDRANKKNISSEEKARDWRYEKQSISIPIMCASGLSEVTCPLAISCGASAVGVGSAVNNLDDLISMIAVVRGLKESLKNSIIKEKIS